MIKPSYRHVPQRAARIGGWLLLATFCFVLGNGAKLLGFPSPHLLVGLLVGVVAALTGLVRSSMNPTVNRGSQAMVGVLMGSYLSPKSLHSVADSLGPLALTTAGTLLLCLVAALILPRVSELCRADVILGMVPGGSAAIIACADEVNADARIVAFMQYARVALVAATAPLVVLATGPAVSSSAGGHEPFGLFSLFIGSTQLVSSPNPVAGLTMLIGMCVLGVSVGRRLGLPAPALLGPMLLAAIALFTGAAGGFAPAGMLEDVVFVLVGMDVGLRFSRASLRQVGRAAPIVLVTTSVVCVGCAGLAALFHLATGISFTDAYLATTPGGINAVLATAASVHADLPLTSTAQSVRLFTVVLLAPPFIRWMNGAGSAKHTRGSARSPVGAKTAAGARLDTHGAAHDLDHEGTQHGEREAESGPVQRLSGPLDLTRDTIGQHVPGTADGERNGGPRDEDARDQVEDGAGDSFDDRGPRRHMRDRGEPGNRDQHDADGGQSGEQR